MLDILGKLPRTNCGECGRATCTSLAFEVKAGRASLSECPYAERQAGTAVPTTGGEDNYEGVCRDLLEEVLGMDRGRMVRWLGTEDAQVTVPVLGVTVRLGDEGLLYDDGNPCEDSWTRIFVLDYLRRQGGAPLSGEWVWPGFFPDTASYVKAFGRNGESRIVARFGDDLQTLRRRCIHAGGQELDAAMGADVTFRFDLLPRVPLYLCYFAPEEGMEADCKILVDRNVQDFLDIEYLAHLIDRFVGSLTEG